MDTHLQVYGLWKDLQYITWIWWGQMNPITTGCCAQCNRRTLNSVDGLERSYFVCVECLGSDRMVQTYNVGMVHPMAFLRDVCNALKGAPMDWLEENDLEELTNSLEYIVQREEIMV